VEGYFMGKQVHENIKAMERDDYTVSFFAQDAVTRIVDFEICTAILLTGSKQTAS
jgi:hypothetical protein